MRKKAMDGWSTVFDGGSDHWLYAREVSRGVFVMLEILALVGYCGRDAEYHFDGTLSVVDLTDIDLDTQESALRSCGLDDTSDMDLSMESLQGRLNMAEVCHSYGAKSPLSNGQAYPVTEANFYNSPSDDNPYFLRLRKQLREYGNTMAIEAIRENALDTTIVNGLGQTAREYANGTTGLYDALARIVVNQERTAEQGIILKMYGMAEV